MENNCQPSSDGETTQGNNLKDDTSTSAHGFSGFVLWSLAPLLLGYGRQSITEVWMCWRRAAQLTAVGSIEREKHYVVFIGMTLMTTFLSWAYHLITHWASTFITKSLLNIVTIWALCLNTWACGYLISKWYHWLMKSLLKSPKKIRARAIFYHYTQGKMFSGRKIIYTKETKGNKESSLYC